MSFFSVKHLFAGYGGREIVRDVSFDAESGCILGILGANGSGKTTLLKAMCGILPHEGSCMLDGTALEDLSARQMARLCSYIPQRSGLSVDISALDVVLMGFNPWLGMLEYPDAAMKHAARRALERVGLGGREEDNYLQLSEGQKQLCILARTLVAGAKLLLLDEPESALDFRCRHSMLDIIRGWVSGGRGSAIVTLHDPILALNECDRLLLLADGRLLGEICPHVDSTKKMEELLGCIYGSISLHKCRSRDGREQIVMIRERETT